MSSGHDAGTTNPPSARRRSIASTGHGDDGSDYCRICRGEGTVEQPLFYPCKCSGSIKFVHQDCLMEWLSHSQKKYCELCKTPFRFTKLYDQSMPDTVPFPLFLRQITLHLIRATARWSRYAFVVVVWLCWLPWTIRQIWRGLFWVADGSWINPQEMRQLLTSQSSMGGSEATGNTLANITNLMNMTGESTTQDRSPIYTQISASIYKLLSPAPLLRGLLRLISRTATSAKIPEEPASTMGISSIRNATFLWNALPRAPSLLSDVKSIRSATRFPVINNLLIDVFEGQLVCLFIIAAFILVFLIREWVINQQPIVNMPEPDPAERPAEPVRPAEQAAQPAVRRRRRGLRRFAEQNAQLDNRGLGFVQRPRAVPRPRRANTDNNLVLQNEETGRVNRPAVPARAASLVPALQEMEASARQLEALQFPRNANTTSEGTEDVQSPPLHRGAFDEMAHVRRNIEESTTAPGIQGSQADNDVEITDSSAEFTAIRSTPPPSRPDTFTFGSNMVRKEGSSDRSEGMFTFRAPSQSTEALVTDEPAQIHESPQIEGLADEDDWTSESEPEVVMTPVDSNSSTEVATGINPPNHGGPDEPSETLDDGGEGSVDDEPKTSWAKLARWLWETEEYIPPEIPEDIVDNAEIVQDPAVEAPFVPVPNPEPQNANRNAPGADAARQPNIQFGVDLNDPNAIDEAEDIEGILELIGMEGPIAGMIQNIIFSVFLITLTLSASVWCPYIWGKIALLFLANPVGVFIKAPLYLVSRTADLLIDVGLFIIGVSGFFLNHLTKFVKFISAPIFPAFSNFLQTDMIEDFSLTLSQKSGNRLEKALSGTLFGLRPDLPTFSMQSHHAMRVFKQTLGNLVSTSSQYVSDSALVKGQTPGWADLFKSPVTVGNQVIRLPTTVPLTVKHVLAWWKGVSIALKPVSFAKGSTIDYSLVQWSTQEKIVCICLGYAFFAFAGLAYLKLAHFFLGLRDDEKVDGFLADTLRQAGGVMKVILIIGIEMIVFPLYCGIMLDFALLPLFEGATLANRLAFLINSPITALFVHWFIGTCYMFHFALFVSMCRKIMRKGVLYFIRDPDDPSFHPVRDVLERPVATQLGKIAFSAAVYGGLLIVCLGGVVLGLSCIGNMLPIHWSADEPRFAFPADIVFYNFLLPYILRRVEISGKISKMYEWWFRGCAGGLRLTHFLFGQHQEDEMRPSTVSWTAFYNRLLQQEPEPAMPKLNGEATSPNEKTTSEVSLAQNSSPTPGLNGTFVRAPATDSVRIPKGTNVFLEVNENNERTDGKDDPETGLHGKNDERFTKIYIPPHFKARVATFVILVWIFAAFTGILFTLGPLVIGRSAIRCFAHLEGPPNDFYAFTIGIHISAMLAYITTKVATERNRLLSAVKEYGANTRQALPRLAAAAKHVLGLLYMILSFGIVLPFTVSLLSELYIHMPLYGYLLSESDTSIMTKAISWTTNLGATTKSQAITTRGPTVYVLQTWTIGLLYLRLIIRIAANYPNSNTRPATAIRSIIRHGLLQPDVRLATRALILPLTIVSIVLLALPLLFAQIAITAGHITTDTQQRTVYRYAYPSTLAVALALYSVYQAKERVEGWRIKIRDEVYLIGERLHNFQDDDTRKKHSNNNRKQSSSASSRKQQQQPVSSSQEKGKTKEDATDGSSAAAAVDDDNKGKGKEVIRDESDIYREGTVIQATGSAEIGHSIRELKQQVEDMKKELDEMETAGSQG